MGRPTALWGRNATMSTETLSQARPHINVGTVGSPRHGKTTLSNAIVARQKWLHGDKAPKKAIDDHPSLWRRHPHEPAFCEYESARRHYAHVDSLTTDNLILGLVEVDAAILVVAADEGPMPAIRETLLLLARLGIHLVVFLNKIDLVEGPDLLDLAELVTRELLQQCALPGDEVPIIRGSARTALWGQGEDREASRCVDELMGVLDTFPSPQPLDERPFLMAIEDVASARYRGPDGGAQSGWAGVGRIERGTVRVGDEVETVGLGRVVRQATVIGLEMFQKPLKEARAGDVIAVRLGGIDRADLQRGQVLASPGSITAHTTFEASVKMSRTEEGGRPWPFFSGGSLHFLFRTTAVTGRLILPQGVEMLGPGDNLLVTIELCGDSPIALDVGLRFAIRESGHGVGIGLVTKVLQ